MIIKDGIFKVGNSWDDYLEPIYELEKYRDMCSKLNELYEKDQVLPSKNLIFKSLELTPYEDVKVVILGEDPYPKVGDANGLAFSYKGSKPYPKSLQNIFSALEFDYRIKRINSDLTDWAKQGVLLLNTILTIDKEGQRLSHKHIGWQSFTDYIIELISKNKEKVIFVLWGKTAATKEKIIKSYDNKHKIIKRNHPSTRSAWRKDSSGLNFINSNQFSEINNILREKGESEIDWFLGDKQKVKTL